MATFTPELTFGVFQSGMVAETPGISYRTIRINSFPASLFAGGVQGSYYDPSVVGSMFQDSAGTTPAAVDSPVGRMNDLSGNGNHLTQSTAGARPILRSSGGVYSLEFDGVDDNLVFPINMLSGWTLGTGLFAAKVPVDPPVANNGTPLGFFANGGGAECWPNTGGVPTTAFLRNSTKFFPADPGDFTAWHNGDFRSQTNDFRASFNNGDQVVDAVNTVAATSGIAGVPSMGSNGFGQFMLGHVGRTIVINRFLTGDDMTNARTWIRSGFGG